jgi:hypothetical protein
MTLALKMGRTLEELGSTMSSQEFSLWIAMYEFDQFGELRADERAGIIASTVANYAGMTRAQGSAPASPADFMLHLPLKKREAEPETEPDPVAYFTAVAVGK